MRRSTIFIFTSSLYLSNVHTVRVAKLAAGSLRENGELARKWRGNRERTRYWRGNGERMRKWRENEEMERE